MNDERRRGLNEDGASLIMVIIFVTLFAVISGVILDFAATGFKTTKAVAEVRDDSHAVEGAIDGAINAIRSSKKGNISEGACPTFTLDANGDDPEVEVTCAAVGTSTGGVFDDQPAWAILSLGTDPGEGIIKTGNFHTLIAGGIFSTNDITTNGGPNCKDISDDSCNALSVIGDIIAVDQCTPNTGAPNYTPERLFVATGGDFACLRGVPDADRTARGADPGYPTNLGSPAALDALSGDQVVALFGASNVDPPATCYSFGSTRLVKFVPGFYTQQLKNLIPAGCSSPYVYWLAPSATECSPALPGNYYLDFPDGAAYWDIDNDNIDVVGGKVTGCSGAAVPTGLPTFPDACVEDASGVQLIMGGETRINVKNDSDNLALCASKPDSSITNQRIAMYGLPSGTPNSAVLNQVRKATTVDAGTNFTNTGFAVTADGAQFAVANLRGGTNAAGSGAVESASIPFHLFEDIPAGSTITAATMEVVHSETGTTAPITMNATWRSVNKYNAAVGTDQTCNFTVAPSASLHTSTCNLLPTLSNATYGPYVYRPFNGIEPVTFNVAADLQPSVPTGCNPQGKNCSGTSSEQTASISIDAVHLKVSYVPPGFEAHDCPSASPNCALLFSENKPTVVIRGTVYAPTALLHVEVHNRHFTDFARGVIVESLELAASASNKLPEQSPFSLPGSSGAAPRIVRFTAKIGGKTRAMARVRYIDKDPAADEFLGYEVEVLDWQTFR